MGRPTHVGSAREDLPARRAAGGHHRHLASAAGRLLLATRTGVPCAPVRDLIGPNDIELAYAVQRMVNEDKIANGVEIYFNIAEYLE